MGVDAKGLPTTEPAKILDGGALLPFGGHKGSTIALMIELLVAGLTGRDFSFEAQENDNNDGGPPIGGELMLAIDPNCFGDADAWLQHSETFLQRLNAMEGTRLPGDRRYACRSKHESEGITIPEELHAKCLGFMEVGC